MNVCFCVSLYVSLCSQVILILCVNLCFSCILCVEFFVFFCIHYAFWVSLFYVCGSEYKYTQVFRHCVWVMAVYTYMSIFVFKDVDGTDRVMSTMSCVQRHSCKFINWNGKRWNEYTTDHKTRSAQNTDRQPGGEENMHTRHRFMKTGTQRRIVCEGDWGYYW